MPSRAGLGSPRTPSTGGGGWRECVPSIPGRRRNDNTTGDIYAGNNSSGGAGPKWILERRIDIVTAGDHVAR